MLKNAWKILLMVAVLAMVTFGSASAVDDDPGCYRTSGSQPTKREMRESSLLMEQAQTEANQKRLSKRQPPPQFDYSQERANLIRRLNAWNVKDKVSYIYLINYGRVMAFYPVKGKVSSVNSFLTTPEQVINKRGRYGGEYGWETAVVVPSPDFDGSYGDNPPGAIFFFTTDGTYVEWHGDYLLCDRPLRVTTQPELVRQVR